MQGEAPAPMYCAHMTGDGCELSNCEEHECHLDDREDVEIRMPDPNTEHGLRVQLATALRERDGFKKLARDMEETVDNVRAALGLEDTHYLVIANQVGDVVKERDALRAALQDILTLCMDVPATEDWRAKVGDKARKALHGEAAWQTK